MGHQKVSLGTLPWLLLQWWTMGWNIWWRFVHLFICNTRPKMLGWCRIAWFETLHYQFLLIFSVDDEWRRRVFVNNFEATKDRMSVAFVLYVFSPIINFHVLNYVLNAIGTTRRIWWQIYILLSFMFWLLKCRLICNKQTRNVAGYLHLKWF